MFALFVEAFADEILVRHLEALEELRLCVVGNARHMGHEPDDHVLVVAPQRVMRGASGCPLLFLAPQRSEVSPELVAGHAGHPVLQAELPVVVVQVGKRMLHRLAALEGLRPAMLVYQVFGHAAVHRLPVLPARGGTDPFKPGLDLPVHRLGHTVPVLPQVAQPLHDPGEYPGVFGLHPLGKHGVPFLHRYLVVEVQDDGPPLHTLVLRVVPVQEVLGGPFVVRVAQHDRRLLHGGYVPAYLPARDGFPARYGLYHAQVLEVPAGAFGTVHQPLSVHGVRGPQLLVTGTRELAELYVYKLLVTEHVLQHPVYDALPVGTAALQYEEVLEADALPVHQAGPQEHLQYPLLALVGKDSLALVYGGVPEEAPPYLAVRDLPPVVLEGIHLHAVEGVRMRIGLQGVHVHHAVLEAHDAEVVLQHPVLHHVLGLGDVHLKEHGLPVPAPHAKPLQPSVYGVIERGVVERLEYLAGEDVHAARAPVVISDPETLGELVLDPLAYEAPPVVPVRYGGDALEAAPVRLQVAGQVLDQIFPYIAPFHVPPPRTCRLSLLPYSAISSPSRSGCPKTRSMPSPAIPMLPETPLSVPTCILLISIKSLIQFLEILMDTSLRPTQAPRPFARKQEDRFSPFYPYP